MPNSTVVAAPNKCAHAGARRSASIFRRRRLLACAGLAADCLPAGNYSVIFARTQQDHSASLASRGHQIGEEHEQVPAS